MSYEVEQKYPVADHQQVQGRLSALGAVRGPCQTQIDTYYAHPQRDFAETDEALRIRRIDQANCMTYKGPKLDSTTKTRQEIELTIAGGPAGAAAGEAMWQALGFRRVAEVTKQRQLYHLDRGGMPIELACDQVQGVGNFVELEIVVDDPAELDRARQALADLARALHLDAVERRSYLELLLA